MDIAIEGVPACGHAHAAARRRDTAGGGASRSEVGEVSRCERVLQGREWRNSKIMINQNMAYD